MRSTSNSSSDDVSKRDYVTVVSSDEREEVVSEEMLLSEAAICDSMTSFAPVGWPDTLLTGEVFSHPENRIRETHDIMQIALFIMTSIRKTRHPQSAGAGLDSQLSASLSTS